MYNRFLSVHVWWFLLVCGLLVVLMIEEELQLVKKIKKFVFIPQTSYLFYLFFYFYFYHIIIIHLILFSFSNFIQECLNKFNSSFFFKYLEYLEIHFVDLNSGVDLIVCNNDFYDFQFVKFSAQVPGKIWKNNNKY